MERVRFQLFHLIGKLNKANVLHCAKLQNDILYVQIHQGIWWFSLEIESQFALNRYHQLLYNQVIKINVLVPPLKSIT